jgi:DtxR family Mn-dependent transcriptional regulator
MTKSIDVLSESRSVGDYLKAVYAIGGADGVVTTGALAVHLSIAPPSVTNMLQRLASLDPPLVVYSKRGGARLTESGRRTALELVRRHRLIERFLLDLLGYSWDEVHAEAERLEHAISEDLADRIARRLGDPVFDPHGDPIPAKDGTLLVRREVPLAELAPGSWAEIARVRDDDPSVLRSLARAGLLPGVRLEVVRTRRPEGALEVRVSGEVRTRVLGSPIADRVHVAPLRSVPASTEASSAGGGLP